MNAFVPRLWSPWYWDPLEANSETSISRAECQSHDARVRGSSHFLLPLPLLTSLMGCRSVVEQVQLLGMQKGTGSIPSISR